jgi:lipopolysaccharide export system protein LptA
MKHRMLVSLMVVLAGTGHAFAAKTPVAADQPIELSADALDVFQPEHKAVFTGNVIAKQGTTTMRAAKMVVFYKGDDAKKPLPADGAKVPEKASAGTAGQGIYKIESIGNVVFTTPAETAQGDTAIYNVDAETIDLTGQSVTLIRDKNVLKGTKLNYNMATGRSVLTGGAGGVNAAGVPVKGQRVQGLFVPTPKGEASDAKKTGQ